MKSFKLKSKSIKNCAEKWVLLLLSLFFLQNCGGGTATGNPLVTLSFGTYSASRGFGLPFITSSFATVSSLTMCFKRLRFKTADDGVTTDPSNDEDNIDFALGEVTLAGTGTTLGSVNLPNGTYTRIEFDLENDCASGKSVQVTNGSGLFSSTSRITIKFDGTLTVAGQDLSLSLQVDSIVTALDAATSSADVKNFAEAASGSF